MTVRPVLVRERARRDILEAFNYYRREAGIEVADRFLTAVDDAFRWIAEFPGSGSTRYSHGLVAANLRFKPIPGYPRLAFYAEHEERVQITRVLHAQRDVPVWLEET